MDCITAFKEGKDVKFKEKLINITAELNNLYRRAEYVLQLAHEIRCGAWPSALPLQSMGYNLNKQEFH